MPELDWAVTYGGLAALAVAAAAADLRSGRIPNALTYPAIALGLVGHTLLGGLVGDGGQLGLAGAAAGLATGFGPMLLAALLGGVGMGDAKLMAAVGALGGWRLALATLFYGLLAALVIAIVQMVRRRVVKRTLARVGRFLLLALVPKAAVLPTTEDSPTVPMGLAFAIGAAAAVAESLAGGHGLLPRL